MKKDIERPEVTDIGVAIVLDSEAESEDEYSVYLINMKAEDLIGVLVSSKGYGEIDGEERKTSILRHYLETVRGHEARMIERIMPEVFAFSNEYWVSFKLGDKMYDKKYTFPPQSVVPKALGLLPVIGKRGLMLT